MPSAGSTIYRSRRNNSLIADTYLLEDNGHAHGFISLVDDNLAALFIDTNRQNQGYGKALFHDAMDLRKVLRLQVNVVKLISIRNKTECVSIVFKCLPSLLHFL
ncbi:GNAT family N-acetyltransferase [Paenibacillus sp. ISL-20]|nr:GNAT family N-acetyltransferase [Paenibacillus sp. ISL-20]